MKNPKPTQLRKLLLDLADKIATAPLASEIQGDQSLYGMRMGKAGRALSKAKAALAEDKMGSCRSALERGMLHLAIAELHRNNIVGRTSNLHQVKIFTSEAGSAEEAMFDLISAVCKIKVLIEYKQLSPSRHVKTKLAALVLAIQENIEKYAADETASRHVEILTDCQALLYRSQFLYARLSGEILLPEKSKPQVLKDLHQLSFRAGAVSYRASRQDSSATREQRRTLEKFTESALQAYAEEEIAEMHKFFRLASIEAESLDKYLEAHPEIIDQAKSEDTVSLKEALSDLQNLISVYFDQSEEAQNALRDLRSEYADLNKLIRQRAWLKARQKLKACREHSFIFEREISKIIGREAK